MFKEPIILPCYFHNSENNTSFKEDEDIPIDLDELILKNLHFYKIDIVGESLSYKGCSAIYVGGDSFTCSLSAGAVNNLIKKHNV